MLKHVETIIYLYILNTIQRFTKYSLIDEITNHTMI